VDIKSVDQPSVTASPTPRGVTPKAIRSALWSCFYALVTLQFFWYALWVPARLPLHYALLIALLPLSPGLCLHLARQKYAIIFAGFGVLAHFTFSAMEVLIAGANRLPALLASFICFGFFMCWYFVVLGEKRGKARTAG
jgi:uncharacterized membrane protein